MPYHRVDLLQLMEEAVEGCWIGHRARLPALAGSEIGSVYAPPTQTSTLTFQRTPVETVLEVGLRASGWNVVCEERRDPPCLDELDREQSKVHFSEQKCLIYGVRS